MKSQTKAADFTALAFTHGVGLLCSFVTARWLCNPLAYTSVETVTSFKVLVGALLFLSALGAFCLQWVTKNRSALVACLAFFVSFALIFAIYIAIDFARSGPLPETEWNPYFNQVQVGLRLFGQTGLGYLAFILPYSALRPDRPLYLLASTEYARDRKSTKSRV